MTAEQRGMTVKFAYKAITSKGGNVKGVIEAETRRAAIISLGEIGYTVINIREETPEARGNIFSQLFNKVTPEELLVFHIQLYNMTNAGIGLLASLDTIQRETRNRKLKSAVQDMIDLVMKGKDFADAIGEHKDIFPDLFISMVRSGESGGTLAVVLGNYADLYEDQLELKQKVTGVLFYPMILTLVGAAIIAFLITFVIPKFSAIFADAGIQLPLPTKLLHLAGTITLRYWHLILITVVLAFLGFRKYAHTKKGKLRLDALMLKLPIVGALNRDVALSRFSGILAMLLKSGVPILQALDLTRGVVQNGIIAGAIGKAAADMEKGESLTAALKKTGEFPDNMMQMIAIGEGTGNMDNMLDKARVFYDKVVSHSLKKLTVVVEPLLLLVMGSAVGLIMASILLPLFKMIDVATSM